MLLLVLALHVATVAMPPVEPQRVSQKRAVQKRTTRKRATRKKRLTRIANVRMNILAPACRTPKAGCTRDPNAKYRVANSQEVADPKARAMQGPFANCGVTGMPVCPSKGQKILTSGE